jgi:hypothetical protein
MYGEWCGGNIQKNSCVTGLDKRFIIFQHFKVSPILPDTEETSEWFSTMFKIDDYVDDIENNIFNIMKFPYYDINIDFENLGVVSNELAELVETKVEPDSPIGNWFGVKGNIGEGVVVSFMYKDQLFRFKVKGEKHSSSKVKKLKKVDSEKEQKKIDFVNNYACKAFRLEQAWQNLYGLENEKSKPSTKDTGDFIRLVIKDVMEEESDVLSELGLVQKDVNSLISKVARNWFFEQLDNFYIPSARI